MPSGRDGSCAGSSLMPSSKAVSSLRGAPRTRPAEPVGRARIRCADGSAGDGRTAAFPVAAEVEAPEAEAPVVETVRRVAPPVEPAHVTTEEVVENLQPPKARPGGHR